MYQMDSIISINFWDEEGTKMVGTFAVMVMPEFGGGPEALENYLKENIKYPKYALDHNITGRVRIEFVVGFDGSIEDVKIKNSVHPLLDAEALRVVKEMPKWTPGKAHNVPVKVSYILPVRFRLKGF